MNEMTTFRWSFEEDVGHFAAAGVKAIGIWRQKLSDFGEEKGIELLAEKGLAVSSVLWAGGFTGSDGRSYQESVADAQEAIRLAAALRASCIIVYSGARGGHTNNHARRLLKTALRELLPLASEMGMTLAIEPMHPGCAAEWTFLTSLNEAVSLMEEMGSDHLKLAFDTYHLGFEPEILDQLSNLASRIAVVELGDGREPPDGEQNRCRFGEGVIPVARMVELLIQNGYNGYFEAKLLGEDVEPLDYGELIAHSKETFESWDRAANVS
jgi:sugar phosphate isomerase/epimerase